MHETSVHLFIQLLVYLFPIKWFVNIRYIVVVVVAVVVVVIRCVSGVPRNRKTGFKTVSKRAPNSFLSDAIENQSRSYQMCVVEIFQTSHRTDLCVNPIVELEPIFLFKRERSTRCLAESEFEQPSESIRTSRINSQFVRHSQSFFLCNRRQSVLDGAIVLESWNLQKT